MRITNLPPYPFAALERTIAQLVADGVDVIRMDIGSPDLPPSDEIISTLQKSAAQADRHGYGGYFGTKQFRRAVATYYSNRFHVEVDPDSEVLSLLGSKEGIANMALAWLDPGDIALVPDPGYPTYSIAPLMVGAKSWPMPLLEANGYLPDLYKIPDEVLSRARLMWLNYPNNPTGAVASKAFLEEAVGFCAAHDILLCFDAPYSDNTYDGYVAPSILEIPGAKDVAIEFNSLSKSHNLAGWRVAMAVGNRVAVRALALVKSNIDSGIALPIQEMAAAALTGDQSWLASRNAVYAERRDIVIAALEAMGLKPLRPKGAIYVWTPVPGSWRAAEFADKLLLATGVSVAPGSFYGEHGEGYFRISLVQKADRLREAMQRWQSWWRGEAVS
ncbi:MAG: aminotransferase class I/II-fold pyridoxal phosphate-dependent enzyme [Anaerolineae bacterium]